MNRVRSVEENKYFYTILYYFKRNIPMSHILMNKYSISISLQAKILENSQAWSGVASTNSLAGKLSIRNNKYG